MCPCWVAETFHFQHVATSGAASRARILFITLRFSDPFQRLTFETTCIKCDKRQRSFLFVFRSNKCTWEPTTMTSWPQQMPAELPDCTCDERQICPDGASRPTPPRMTNAAGDVIYNLTGSMLHTEDYLIRTFDEFIDKRYLFWGLFPLVFVSKNRKSRTICQSFSQDRF